MTTEGFPGAPGRTLRIRRAAGGARDVRAPVARLAALAGPPCPADGGPVRRPGPADIGPCPSRSGTGCGGSRTHANRTHSESCRGLSRPAGVHLNFALGLSNEVGPPHRSRPPAAGRRSSGAEPVDCQRGPAEVSATLERPNRGCRPPGVRRRLQDFARGCIGCAARDRVRQTRVADSRARAHQWLPCWISTM